VLVFVCVEQRIDPADGHHGPEDAQQHHDADGSDQIEHRWERRGTEEHVADSEPDDDQGNVADAETGAHDC